MKKAANVTDRAIKDLRKAIDEERAQLIAFGMHRVVEWMTAQGPEGEALAERWMQETEQALKSRP